MNNHTTALAYPVFQPNQVLTDKHLNQAVAYLEVQNRLTRSHLIGTGIVCGLELTTHIKTSGEDQTMIRVSPGCGITSEGYLARLAPAPAVLTYCRPLSLLANALLCLPPGEADQTEEWSLFELLSQTDAQDLEKLSPGEVVTLDEMLAEQPEFLAEKVVLLWHELADDPLDTCISDCDERGVMRQARTRFLLISKTKADELIRKGFDPNDNHADQSLEDLFQHAFLLKDIEIKRFGWTADGERQTVDLTKVKNHTDYLMGFGRVCMDAFDSISEALGEMEHLFSPFFTPLAAQSNAFAHLYEALNHTLNSFGNSDDLTQQKHGIQYFYDYLLDLTDTYNELRQEAFDLMSDCCPNACRFPRHLMLGEVLPQENCRPSLYRSHFAQPPIFNGNARRLGKVKSLYERLLVMTNTERASGKYYTLKNFHLPEVAEIKILPGQGAYVPLSERAIPFYYQQTPNLRKYWSYDLYRKCKANSIESYFSETDPRLLIQNINSKPFFRIEGHLGKEYARVLSFFNGEDGAANGIRHKYNLPFDVVGLKIGTDWKGDVEMDCHFEELENLYIKIRSDLMCSMLKVMAYVENEDRLDEYPDAKTDFTIALLLVVMAVNNVGLGDFKYYHEVPIYAVKGDAYEKIDSAGAFSFYLKNDKEEVLGYPPAPFDAAGDRDTAIDETITAFTSGQIRWLVGGIDIQQNKVILHYYNGFASDQAILHRALEVPGADLAYEGALKLLIFQLFDMQLKQVPADILSNLEQQLGCVLTSSEPFKQVYDDYHDRRKAITESLLFHGFSKCHPGMEHLAGVPEGGTFVVVYVDQLEGMDIDESEEDQNVVPGDIGDINWGKWHVKTDQQKTAARAMASEVKQQAAQAAHTTAYGAAKTALDALNEMKDIEAVAELLSSLKRVIRVNFRHIVVGDFALPYFCCSECPPIAQVLARPKPIIYLTPIKFCSDDDTEYPITVYPLGGQLNSPPGVIDHGDGNYFFQPAAADIGTTQLTYFAEGETVHLTITVSAAPEAKFSEEWREPGGEGEYHIKFNNESLHTDASTTYLWEFGDATSSTEYEPTHTFVGQNTATTYQVKLTVTHPMCGVDTATLDVEIPCGLPCEGEKEECEYLFWPLAMWYYTPGGYVGDVSLAKLINQYSSGQFTNLIMSKTTEGTLTFRIFTCSLAGNSLIGGLPIDIVVSASDVSTPSSFEEVVKVVIDRLSQELNNKVPADTLKFGYGASGVAQGASLTIQHFDCQPFEVEMAYYDPDVPQFKFTFKPDGVYMENQPSDQPLTPALNCIKWNACDDSPVSECVRPSFDYEIIGEGEHGGPMVKFSLVNETNADPVNHWFWEFYPDGTPRLSDQPNPEIDFNEFGEKWVQVMVKRQSNCVGAAAMYIDIPEPSAGLPDLTTHLESLDHDIEVVEDLPNEKGFDEIFPPRDPLLGSVLAYFKQLKGDLADPALAATYISGSKNNRIATQMGPMLQGIHDKLTGLAGINLEIGQKPALKLYRTVVRQVLNFISLQDKDLKPKVKLAGVLDQIKGHLSGFGKKGINSNSGGAFTKILDQAEKDCIGKPFVQGKINELIAVL